MERLTKRFEGIEEASLSCERCGKNAIYECWSQENCTQTAVDRLASIEDILGDTYDLDRLRELVEAGKDGRCVVLPCKYGERVYCVYTKQEEDYGCAHCTASYGMGVACDYYNDETGECANKPEKYKNYEIVSKHFEAGMIPDFGKTVFKNSKDAEYACERLEKERALSHEN